jgi:hypothetical protein
MGIKLTKRPVATMFRGTPTPFDPIIRWMVDPLDQMFIHGFNVGRPNQKEYWRIANRKDTYESAEQAVAALQDLVATYIVSVQKTSNGYNLFRDGQLRAVPKDEWTLELQLNSEGILEDICQDVLRRVRETGTATEEMPRINFKIL